MKKNQSEEDYLEAILVVKEKKGNVRSIDVVNELNVSKPSVSVAMKKLRSKELITFDDNGYISFTSEGRSIAENIYSKHKLLTDALISIGVDKEEALKEACEIEHIISDQTYECIKKYYKKVK
ncbi:MAG: metal-dependent transcriptional regulator [Lachnospiraceae bacterium]|nr:metal-dependent transcriptional regulator [Lachnospiraceae bacterium]